MQRRFLQIHLTFSGFIYNLKRKTVEAEGLPRVALSAVELLLAEFLFALFSMPLYLAVSPDKLQERGIIFPDSDNEPAYVNRYILRRKISLVTVFGAGGAWVLKVMVIGLVSFLFWGAQQILADTQSWTFGTPSDYTISSSSIEFSGGVARLKNLGTSGSGSTSNFDFSTSSVGWTFISLLDPGGGTNTGAYNSTGGNIGGYLRVTSTFPGNKTAMAAWYQAFTTTINSPTTGTLILDWKAFALGTPLTSYHLYAFVSNSIVAPTIGTQVWDSGNITAATGWASVAPIDIHTKLGAAGTYYVILSTYMITPSGGSKSVVAGFDNVQINWSGATTGYDATSPSITPNTSLSAPKIVSWNSLTENSTLNGGSITYQLSEDNGTNWKYWDGVAWATTTLSANTSSASIVSAHIAAFPTSTNQIKWKAFLNSNGSQQVILNSVAIDYTPNNRPNVLNVSPTQQIDDGMVDIPYSLQDTESDISSLSAYDFSTNSVNWTQMTASTTDPAHSGVASLTASPLGTAHVFVWNAFLNLGATYNPTTYVRLRANDGIGDGPYTTSSAFVVDFVPPVVSNITSTELLNSTDVQINYDLADDTSSSLNVVLQVSSDGGTTWTVPVASTTGAVGSGVSTGVGNIITWHAGQDYPNHQLSTMRIRLRATDKFQNQAGYITSTSDFTLDTLPPATLTTANLISQPNAGDTTVTIGGSFTEVNPSTNTFYAEVSGGGYPASGTNGTSNTASPSNQATTVSGTLRGNDYISKVKIVHTDDYGQLFSNENTSPSSSIKYVKPYTPAAPTLSNPVTTRLDLQINPNINEASGLEYAIYVSSTNQYVQSNGTLGASAVWQTLGTAAGQWGNGLAVSGQVRVTGLSSPVANYIFKVKSRNTSDALHAASSESSLSASAQITNTAPSISLNTVAQTTDGSDYTNINYTGTDGQGDITNLVTYQYSLNGGLTWATSTEKASVGSNGVTNLIFAPTGSAYLFAWNSGLDAPNVETTTAKIRLQGNDTLASGSIVTSANFAIDNKTPVTASVTAVEGVGTKIVTINYNLTDANNSTVYIDISSDGGSTWTVATSTLSGAVGSGVTPGNGKSVTWNAGTNFNNQFNTNMLVRVRAVDEYGNVGNTSQSSAFTVDTHAPVITNLTAAQDSAADTFTFHYDLAEDLSTVNAVLAISSDGGSTWSVATSSAAGAFGSSVATGTSKTITWNGITDYNNQEKTAMQFRITATDQYGNQSINPSGDFNLDTEAPRVTSVSANQPLATTTITITYSLADQNNSTVAVDLSSDSGSTWTVATTTLAGAIGSGQGTGSGKTITWNPKIDFNNQTLSTMKVRVRANDIFNNLSNNVTSSAFSLDTLPPATLVTADLISQPNAGDTTVLLGGSFTETNPGTNNFYLAVSGGAYGSATAGSSNTASPANQATAAGVTLKGNDYISKVKIIHADDFGQATDNENTSPNSAFIYVKPYTPQAPTVDNPGVGTVDVLVNKNVAEVDGLEYAIFENTTNQYVLSNGTLGASAVWQTLGTAAGQWGNNSGTSGKVSVSGLVRASYAYQFQVKSRNTSDAAHAVSSESALGSGASSVNQSPSINFTSLLQTTDGTQYVDVNYRGTDLESDTSTLATYQYSQDNSTWHTMTEKSGVGSSGVGSLLFVPSPGATFHFMWDVGTDLANTEDSTIYVRLKANDGTSDGGVSASNAFTVDTKNPVISSVSASQTSGTRNVVIGYTLTDLSSSNVELNISSDGGSTWTVATTSVSGNIGPGVAPGSGQSITWDAGTDFNGQEVSNMKVKLRALDAYGNQGAFASSANFALDTKAPLVSSVSASQLIATSTVNISYTLADQNNSAVYIEISDDNGSTWNIATTTLGGNVGSGVTPGSKTAVWNALIDYPLHQQSDMMVRVRAVDVYGNDSGTVSSGAFSVDTSAPGISSLLAAQQSGSTNVIITYNLVEPSTSSVSFDVSSDGGSTWIVATSTATGDFGSGLTTGSKTIVWNAGTDFGGQQNSNMAVRLRGADVYNNISNYVTSSAFSVDTKSPAVNVAADLTAQPNAGDTTALIGGSFTEINPSVNNFFVAINSGAYGVTTTGQSGTASPANQATNVGLTLTGADYISKVKITETDTYNQSGINENTSPSTSFKYVKPHTPETPIANNPQASSVDVTINAHSGESASVEYAIYEASSDQYVQTNGTLGASAVWKTLGTGVGQWGNSSGVSGKITVSGLSTPVAQYQFKVKSRNPSDAAHQSSSESALSTAASAGNTAPSLSISSVAQTSGQSYVIINYIGADAENNVNNLNAFEYSTDNTNWFTMTEKAGVGSSGTSSLGFTASGTAFTFAWDAGADLANQENASVRVRLKSSDSLLDSNLAVSSAFAVDAKGPVASNISVSQSAGTNNFSITYDLSDQTGANNNVVIQISSDGGATWNIPTTTLSGDVGSSVSAGTGRSVVWNAGTDYVGHQTSTMRVRITGTDSFNNAGSFVSSNNFSLDTAAPAVSLVSAAQATNGTNFTVSYTLSDGTVGGNSVDLEVSSDGGSTWAVATSSATGDVGSGITTGVKIISWNAGLDYNGHSQNNMRARIRARDYFGNQGLFVSSANFDLDTKAPVISLLSASQVSGTNVAIGSFDIAEDSATATVRAEISEDGGFSWTVATSTLAGDVNTGVASGASKAFSWNIGTDFPGQEVNTMRVRLFATDVYGNESSPVESADFSADTKAPTGLSALTLFSSTLNSQTLSWATGVADAHFNHYELWHGSVQSDVDSQSGTAQLWSTSSDSGLSNILTNSTVISPLTPTGNYYVKIFAVDNYGHVTTIPSINIFTPAPTPTTTPTPVVIQGGFSVGPSQPTIAPTPVSAPTQPIIQPVVSPTSLAAITVSGLATPGAVVDLYDNGTLIRRLTAPANANGEFSQVITLGLGSHTLTAKAVNSAGASDFSTPVLLTIVAPTPTPRPVVTPTPVVAPVITLPKPGVAPAGVPAGAAVTGAAPLPAAVTELLKAAQGAVEVPQLPAPQVVTAAAPAVSGTGQTQNTLRFTGRALPNQEVIIYIHSDQAVIYQTKADINGNWTVDHNQATLELSPGVHTIFAVAVDPTNKVKSKPSATEQFTVVKSFWVDLFNRLNLTTTIVVLAATAATAGWLYLRRRRVVTA